MASEPTSKKSRILPLLLIGAFVLLGLSAIGVTMFARQSASNAAAIGGPFRLHTGGGKTVTEADLRGTPFLVFFGYTHCPDVCPLTLTKIAQVLKELGPAARIKILFVTVDPERDTPDRMADYASDFDPRVIGLSGDRGEVDAMLSAYRVYARKVPTPSGDYSMDHSAVIYLMDREGKFLRSVNLDRPPDQVAKDLRAAL
ncbi:redoxin domain-containing protein [Rhodoblastus acidophilus]|uniref:Redoxin domain-containing protein n=1 Tax=Rhodoblastus acidophilus TaxID=1074 RepID=A0A6N8DJE8_RHOAC|nr:SCO family protein [Rhodoblastus acidophilus]MCW2274097.1 protein SCO1/2 [Rhodoblastus acidophilus]MTV30670.1 redoxin domain-containing protein [Rhodoblastus acidophilus]